MRRRSRDGSRNHSASDKQDFRAETGVGMGDSSTTADVRDIPEGAIAANALVPLVPLVPVTARGAATRRKLLQAASDEFGSRGFHIASVSSITARAEVGQGTFYLYFRTKEEIFVTLVRDIGVSIRALMRDSVVGARHQLDAERSALGAFFGFAQAHPGLCRIVAEAQFVDPPAFREYYEQIAKGYAEDLDAAANRGELAPGDAEIRAWALLGIGDFLVRRHCLWHSTLPSAPQMDALMDLIAHGLAARQV